MSTSTPQSQTPSREELIRRRMADGNPVRKRLWLPEPFTDIEYTDVADEDEDDESDTD